MSTLRTAKLIFVDVDTKHTQNSNKYYHIFEQNDNQIRVEYGRVEKTKQIQYYPSNMFDKKIKEKERKGYKNVTHLFQEAIDESGNNSLAEIQNKVIKKLIDDLQSFAQTSIKNNYSISSAAVTEIMVNEAQSLIDKISPLIKKGNKTTEVNPLFLELYKIIPRKMDNVKNYLLQNDIKTDSDLKEAQELLANEQSTLDVMSGQVDMNKKKKLAEISNKNTGSNTVSNENNTVSNKKTILDSLGLEIEETSDDDIKIIKKMMQDNSKLFKKAFKVNNNKTEERFKNHLNNSNNKTTELFWHGSKNQNIYNIIQTGLLIRPAGVAHTGSMFSDGKYFADKFQKSLGYTSYNGSYWAKGNSAKAYLIIYEVHIGKQYHVYTHNHECYNFSAKYLKAKGNYDSVYAHRGADLRNNEYIVYDIAQSTIKYIVEIGD